MRGPNIRPVFPEAQGVWPKVVLDVMPVSGQTSLLKSIGGSRNMKAAGDNSGPIPARPEASGQESDGNEVEVRNGAVEMIEDADGSPSVDDDRRPTPVRLAMEGSEDEDGEDTGMPRLLEDPDSGLNWIVTVAGRSAGGILPLRTVPIMELNFTREDLPKEDRQSVLCFGNDLSEIPDQDLLECLRRSGPFREPMRPLDDRDRNGRQPR
jgi:hypothetical protein